MHRSGLFVLTLAAVLTLPGAAAAQDALSLSAVLERARERSPRMASYGAASQAARLRVAAASTLPDPQFQVGFMNLALPELSANMPASMAPSLQLSQGLPFPGKRALRGEMAGLEADMAEATEEEAWWQLRTEVAARFLEVFEVDRHTDVQRATLGLLRDFESVAKALYAAGTGPQADVLRANVEVARMEGELRRLEARRLAAGARLNALLDQDPGLPIPAVALPPLPAALPPTDSLLAWAADRRPLLDRGRDAVAHAEAAERLAARDRWPDLMVGIEYGQRNRGVGMERMGSAMVGFTLPVWAGRRQGPARDAALAEVSMAEASLNEIHAEIAGWVLALEAELARTRSLIALYRESILPQARAAVSSAMSAYRTGEVDFATLVDAELAVSRFELEFNTLLRDYGTAVASMEGQIGHDLPHTDPLEVEVP